MVTQSSTEAEQLRVTVAVALMNSVREYHGLDPITWDCPAISSWHRKNALRNADAAIAAMRGVAQAAPEPVAWRIEMFGKDKGWYYSEQHWTGAQPLYAAPQPLDPAYAPEVRPLEWEAGKGQLDGQLVWSAGEPWLFWIVKNPNEPQYIWCENFNIEGFFPCSPVRGSFENLDLAKAAAQADYTNRILGALVVSSTQRDGGAPSAKFSQCEQCWQPATCKKYGCSVSP